MKKRFLLLLLIGMMLAFAMPVQAASDTIIVFGEKLSNDQRQEVLNELNMNESDVYEAHDVTGADYQNYIDGNPNSNMYSSARIILEKDGAGITVNIATPSNITAVSREMYENALLTAGAENATVDVVSPVRVSGESALTGIYKAYDAEGEELDKDRMVLANDELELATDLTENEDVTQEDVSQLLTDIKTQLAEQDPVTREEVEQIVEEQLSKLEISLSDEDKQMLIDLVDRMRDLEIDFGAMKEQLDDIAGNLIDRAEELGLDEGFWKKVANFFSDIFQAMANFFKGLFN